MLGYLPSPFIYGLIADSGNARMAMGTLMSTPMIATALMWIGCYIIMRDDLLPKLDTPTHQRKPTRPSASSNQSKI